MTVTEFLRRLEGLNIDRIVKIVIGETRELIIIKNQEQMLQGIRSDGSEITPPYTFFTRIKKKEKGRNPDIVTLYDTGDFYRAMFLDVGSDMLEIESTDWKSSELQEKYGEKIFGLTDESKNEYAKEALTALIEKIKNNLNL